MASVWRELKRRNVVRVAVAYAVVGWLLVEVASVMGPALNLPDWVTSSVAFFVILGFPLALVLSWAYELTPEGMKKTKAVPLSESVAKVTGRKLDFVIIGLLMLAVGFMFVDNYLPESGPFAGAEIDPASLEVPTATVEVVSPIPIVEQGEERGVLPNSVAVLPLENLSPDPDNAYFAAGMHEEILNHLAKLGDLNVISRTSVVRYTDSDLSIPEIAGELNVETVMEGSVRYANDRVLVTIQLIDPETDAHLWSESYNRDLADVFAIQADIAMNVANALQAEFSVAEQRNIEKIPTVSPEAYTLYLKFLATLRDDADLDRALELDPDFALAYGAKAWWHSYLLSLSVDLDIVESERLALENAEKALSLDPSLGLAHLALANLHEVYWRWTEAREAYEVAYGLSPNDIAVLTPYGRYKRSSGDYADAIRVGVRTVALDPINAESTHQLGVTYRYAKDYESAAQSFRRTIALDPESIGSYTLLGVVEATRGNYDEAVRNLRIAEELSGNTVGQIFRYPQLAVGYAMAGRREDAERLFGVLEERSQRSPVGEAVWALAYIALDDYERALQHLETAMATPSSASYTSLVEIKGNPWGNPVLDEPRFKEVLADFWSE